MGGSSSRGNGAPVGYSKKVSTCEDLVISTDLKSPVEEVVELLSTGDILQIQVLYPDECVALFDGKKAGKIVCIELKSLLECIKLGNSYIAEVRNVHGIRCSVTISKD